MKKFLFHFILLAFLILSIPQQSFSQYSEARKAISLNAVGVDYYSPFKDDFYNSELSTIGLKFAYHQNLYKDLLNIEFPLGLSRAYVPNNARTAVASGEFTRDIFRANVGALLQLQLFKPNNILVPYLSAGLAGTYIDNGENPFHLELPLGVGLDIKLTDITYFQIRPEYRLGFIEDNRDNYNLNVGLKWLVGKENKEPEPPKPMDKDKDGITDDKDKCPDIPGIVALQGCPDTDGDGIADEDDLCPKVAGLASMNGCPDTDGDGLTDSKDNCPNEAGPESNQGCPISDSDGDGIPDDIDDCKDQPGLAAFNGCPDTDGDGIKDSDDECPRVAGMAKFNGCPDKDGDGVRDVDDRCPNEAGPADNNGCPKVKEEVIERLNFAAQNINFETNSSVIKTSSYAIMDEVAQILKEYPAYNVSIEGHTDSQGNADYNQRLSEKRAASCLEYLAKKGVERSRMSSVGYGETLPIADNKTRAGRDQNRRVEFKLYLRK